MKTKKLLEALLEQIKSMHYNIHYHLDRMEIFYKMVHGIKKDGKMGAWVEDKKAKKRVAMDNEIQGKVATIHEGSSVLIAIQRDKPIITVRGQTTTVNTVGLVCVTPELFRDIKKAMGDLVGKRFFIKGKYAYIQDQKIKKNKAKKNVSMVKFADFVIFPPESAR